LVCKWKKQDTGGIFQYLKESHELMWSWNGQPDTISNDIIELVPLQIITNPENDFFNYIVNSNNVNGCRQIQNLKKIHAFYRDETKFENRQRQVRFDCLRFWQIPNFQQRDDLRLMEQFRNSLSSFGEGTELKRSNIENLLSSPLSWRFTILEGKQTKRNTGFYKGEGRLKVSRWEGNAWKPLQSFEKFELSKDTLVYGELVYELRGQVPNQTKSLAFHIIDGFVLGGRDISQEDFQTRIELCTVFAKAMNKGTNGFIGVRAKLFYSLDELPHLLQSFRWEAVKGEGRREKLISPIDYNNEQSAFIQPSAILLFPIPQDPWTIEFSRTNNREYWFNRKKNLSIFEVPFGGYADISYACQKRVVWWLDEHTHLNPELSPSRRNPHELNSDRVHAYDFVQFLYSKR
jgi:cap1 methyltransferase